MNRRHVLLGGAGLLAWAAGPSAFAGHFPDKSTLLALIQARIDEKRAKGLILGVREADGSTQIVAAGDPGAGAALGPDTVVEIASITKVFTGVLLAEMAQRGEVDMTAPAQSYAPAGLKLPTRNGKQITLEQLAAQTSGLPRLPNNMPEADPANPYADYSFAHLASFLAGYELPRDPGAGYEYSNLGFGLLGLILCSTAGGDYETIVKQRILNPLGMTMTGITLSPSMRSNLAQGHDKAGNATPLWDMPVLAGMGGLRSTMNDMLIFLGANVRDPVTPLDRAIHESHRVREQRGAAGTGLAWRLSLRGPERSIFHDGGSNGFVTLIGFDPNRKVSAAIFSNSTSSANDLVPPLIAPPK